LTVSLVEVMLPYARIGKNEKERKPHPYGVGFLSSEVRRRQDVNSKRSGLAGF